MRFFRRTKASIPEHWQLVDRGAGESLWIERFNAGAAEIAGAPGYETRVEIAVPISSHSEFEQLEEFEEAILKHSAGRAVLVGVVTTNEGRSWVLYTGSEDWLARFRDELRRVLPRLDVQLTATHDPDWSAFWEWMGDVNPGDRDLIRLMVEGGEQLATRPRETTHYLHFETGASAQAAVDPSRAAGFVVDIEGPGDGRDDWQVQAKHTILVNEETITSARQILTSVAEASGGFYDGWDTYADAALDAMATDQ